MKLYTKAQYNKLINNGKNRDQDHKPVVKWFNPTGGGTWLISEIDSDNTDIAFGLCDLGMGFPELGSVSINELEQVVLPFGLKIERDLYFKASKTVSQYANDASNVGYIIT